MPKIKIWIDEAGRWPWAGPVVAVAFCFDADNMPDDGVIEQMNDSKKLTAKKREALYEILVKKWIFGVGVVDNYVIDAINIRQANREAMRRAIVELKRKLSSQDADLTPNPSPARRGGLQLEVLIDGRDNYEFDELDKKPVYIVGWDGKIVEIGAASIIAKVFRDKLMSAYASLYPQFGFDSNAGYGTKKHREQLEHPADVTGIHRTSYKPVQEVINKKPKLLLHVCCGPDATVPIMDLKKDYEVICFWYDPNIQPKREHDKRLGEMIKICDIEWVDWIEGEYDVLNFFERIKGLEATPERGEKCTECYDMRLERTALEAHKLWITHWTSTLNTSPHKDLKKMFSLGDKWSKTPPNPLQEGEHEFKERLNFLKIAFRKNKWFERSVEYTKKYDIYRQNYCGCIYSDTFPGGKSEVKR